MTRQNALDIIWRRLLVVFLSLTAIGTMIAYFGGSIGVPALVFLFGNLGAYLSVNRGLASLKDQEIIDMAGSWWSMVVPSFAGGLLAFVVYILFLSNIVSGEIFPSFVSDSGGKQTENFRMLYSQHAKDVSSYAKLFFWSFVSGFNQQFAIDMIESVKKK